MTIQTNMLRMAAERLKNAVAAWIVSGGPQPHNTARPPLEAGGGPRWEPRRTVLRAQTAVKLASTMAWEPNRNCRRPKLGNFQSIMTETLQSKPLAVERVWQFIRQTRGVKRRKRPMRKRFWKAPPASWPTSRITVPDTIDAARNVNCNTPLLATHWGAWGRVPRWWHS